MSTSSRADSLLNRNATVRLTADLSLLDDAQREMIGLLVEAAGEMDTIFWAQAYGAGDSVVSTLPDAGLRRAVARSRDGTYRIDFNAMQEAMVALSKKIIVLQGDGEYGAVDSFVTTYGSMDSDLQMDLERVNDAGIPVDLVFE